MRGVEFEVIWFDENVVEYRVQCANASFCGATKLYSGHDDLPAAAHVLSGFPVDSKDSRAFELGAFDPKMAGGGVSLHVSCVDSVGHSVVLAKLRADGCKGTGEAQSVCLYIPIEAGGIDSFVKQVSSMPLRRGAKASLQMTDSVDWWNRWLAGTERS